VGEASYSCKSSVIALPVQPFVMSGSLRNKSMKLLDPGKESLRIIGMQPKLLPFAF